MGPEHTVSFKDDQYVLALFIETPCQLLGPGTPRLLGKALQYNLRDTDIQSSVDSSVYLLLSRGTEDLGASHYHPEPERPVQDRQKTSLEWRSRHPMESWSVWNSRKPAYRRQAWSLPGKAAREG